MSLNLTPIASDNFTRANENPLSQGGNWTLDTFGDAPLEIVSDLCQSTTVFSNAGEFYSGVSTPNDQYASMTISFPTNGGENLLNRATDNGSTLTSLPAYRLIVFNFTGGWELFAATSLIASGPSTVASGDVWTLAVVGTTVYIVQNGTILDTITNTSYASGLTMLAISPNASQSATLSNFVMGSASFTVTTYSISGNAGVASALISYAGIASGNVTADGSGNYTISNLSNGSYTITPNLAGYTFSPTSRAETVSGSNITGVNFTATATGSAWSPVDSRTSPYGPNNFRVVQGSDIYDVPSVYSLKWWFDTAFNRTQPLPEDSRKAGAPTDSRNGDTPENSRTNPVNEPHP
jgi:hypothetical protein